MSLSNDYEIKTQLLTLLTQNSRQSSADMAAQLGISVAQVDDTIQLLQESGVIAKFTTIVNYDRLQSSDETVSALIELEIRPEKREGFDKVAKRICQYDNVSDHYLISGRYDFLLTVTGRTLQDVALFVSEKLAPIEHVKSTSTHFILKKYKTNGVTLDTVVSADRLAVSP